ncbi:hypothetical protein LCGC14_1341510 [marine sediment metagenome]|uniref:Uncharacterized protein n=1 Tax=marine sediment metagenome TaxID=412755 RepID=A0A0F9L003_9ZZZZ
MKERTVTHILLRKPLPNGGYITFRKSLCGRAAITAYRDRIPRFYLGTCKHCIQAQITTHNRRLPGRDQRWEERRS